MASLAEENYLKLIYHLSGSGADEVSTNALAEQTQTRAASVTDMLRKLAEKNLVHYKKYQGVRLTPEGQEVALQVIRRHRLWEVFMVQKLGFRWDEVHPIAEELEHIASEELINRLDAFLDFPVSDPHGDPIPTAAGKMPSAEYEKLCEVTAGKQVTMMGVSEHAASFLQFLSKAGLIPGSVVSVLEINDFDRSMLLKINESGPSFVSYEVARNILIKFSV
ncbi:MULTISPECIES: metal-dependent transcriptional regulator [unclassified Siphonobacter]|uniref:metal-dependent transcriptional regulator n=1 Tax=unclassified Siphonobacter TaxID=2635712 RepID=UPI002787097D|nr:MULTISPECIES: metal-dependent transcriptional regulator [unclassified Siphonobacter]MDQ1087756.1 DtxR family Mn-dependent transcriptional regulator [Siphonobacter sp. SORGH_AS_1065]MDR6193902.1 DtxR family Mn-dependent transcriptional regulator [Siphonobacter sp. SORGH_AS_0500]